MTARESRAAAAAAGAGGSAAANPIMQIGGGRGLGLGGGFALSGSGIWQKFTQAEGAGTPRAGGPHRAQLGEWRTVPERSQRWGAPTETSQPHFSRYIITHAKSYMPGPIITQVHKPPPTHTHWLPTTKILGSTQGGRHTSTHRLSITHKPVHDCSHTHNTGSQSQEHTHTHSHTHTTPL